MAAEFTTAPEGADVVLISREVNMKILRCPLCFAASNGFRATYLDGSQGITAALSDHFWTFHADQLTDRPTVRIECLRLCCGVASLNSILLVL